VVTLNDKFHLGVCHWKSSRTAIIEKGKSDDEGKDIPINALKAYRGSRGTAPLILILSVRWLTQL